MQIEMRDEEEHKQPADEIAENDCWSDGEEEEEEVTHNHNCTCGHAHHFRQLPPKRTHGYKKGSRGRA